MNNHLRADQLVRRQEGKRKTEERKITEFKITTTMDLPNVIYEI